MEEKFDELNIQSAKANKFQAILIGNNFFELAGVIMFVS